MSTTTRQTSLAHFSRALIEHGWTYTVQDVTVTVPDKSINYASTWSSRQAHPRVQAPGTVVRFTNGSPSPDRSTGFDNVSGRLYFTEAGAYLPGMTRGDYPITAKMSLSQAVQVLADKAPDAVRARVDRRIAERQAKHDETVRAAEQDVTASQVEVALTDAAALDAVVEHVGVDRAQARRILDALEADTRLQDARHARVSLQHRVQVMTRAVSERALAASRGWSF